MLNIKDVRKRLLKKGIDVYPSTLRLHSQQGGVNEIFTVDSNKGKLLLHVGKHHTSEMQYQKAKRIFYLSQFLSKHPKIPTVEVLDFGKDSKGNVYTVEIFIEGESYKQKNRELMHLQHLAQIIAHLHSIEIQGAGYITYKNDKVCTTHKDWYKFLVRMSYKSLREIYNAKLIRKEEYTEFKLKLGMFFKKYRDNIELVSGKLMHGDLTLGNVIVGKEEINAIIDLEFSCVGDPAWEFAAHDYLKGSFLENYFLELKNTGVSVDEDNFRFRISLYDVIKQLVIANSIKKTKYFQDCWMKFKNFIGKML